MNKRIIPPAAASRMATSPAPSAAEIKQLLALTVAKPSRPGHLALLIAALFGTTIALALLVTEPELPRRTQVAFTILVLIGASWSVFAIWVLLRRGVLLGRHRVVAASMAVAFCTLFACSVGVLGLSSDSQNHSPGAWYGAMATGAVFLSASIVLLLRARSRFAALTERRATLERQLKGAGGAIVLMFALLSMNVSDSHAQTVVGVNGSVTTQAGTFMAGGQPIPVIEGRFSVRSNRTSSSTTLLKLAFVQFKSTSAAPRAPIVFLAGGPGDAATRALAGMPKVLLDQLLSVSDVIAFDQRGTGLSEPINAFCAPGEFLPRDRAADAEALLAILRPRVETCLERARAQGVDVSGLNTGESADDIEGLRLALGVPTLMLLAGSYGTHLALATAKRHPTSIDRMVLAGVEGLDDTFKLPSRVDGILEAIAAAKRPTLVADLRTLRARLAGDPSRFIFPTGQTIVLGEWDLQRWVSESLDAVPKIDAMVAAVAAMLDGNFAALGQWALGYRVPKPLGLMNLAMDCASYASPERLKRIDEEARTSVLGNAINFPLPGICSVPGLPRLPDSYREAFSVSAPALLISGTFDGRTPPQNAIDAARNLPMSRQLVIKGASHSLFRESEMTTEMLRFFRQ